MLQTGGVVNEGGLEMLYWEASLGMMGMSYWNAAEPSRGCWGVGDARGAVTMLGGPCWGGHVGGGVLGTILPAGGLEGVSGLPSV